MQKRATGVHNLPVACTIRIVLSVKQTAKRSDENRKGSEMEIFVLDGKISVEKTHRRQKLLVRVTSNKGVADKLIQLESRRLKTQRVESSTIFRSMGSEHFSSRAVQIKSVCSRADQSWKKRILLGEK